MTMHCRFDPFDCALLDRWQRDLPLVPQPFAAIAATLDLGEGEVLMRLERLAATGAISRIGGTCRPNTAAASTLAAVSAPAHRVDEVAGAISAEPGVNHCYLREHAINIWFVATGPDRAHVDATLARIARATGFEVLDLRLVRPFNVDLGFGLEGASLPLPLPRDTDTAAIEPGDGAIIQALCEGLPILPRPYAAVAAALGRPETEVLERIRALSAAGVIGRVGVIVRHRALGWTSNAMVVWQVEEAAIEAAGRSLLAVPGVTLCYQRRPAGAIWPFTLYCMIHARSRPEAMAVLGRATEAAGLAGVHSAVLFSLRCFKQRGALVAVSEGAAA